MRDIEYILRLSRRMNAEDAVRYLDYHKSLQERRKSRLSTQLHECESAIEILDREMTERFSQKIEKKEGEVKEKCD